MKRILNLTKAGLFFLGFFLLIPAFGPARAQDNPSTPDSTPQPDSKDKTDLSQMSLESLTGLNVVVTSSAKKAESLRDATSALYVITAEDIRRSGFQHLADLLKMVPGVQDNQD